MKYIRNFNESVLDNIIELLERDCKPFLDELSKYQSGLIFRGFDTDISDFISINVDKNRKPKDMNKFVSERLDELFYKSIGYRLRSEGVFVTKDEYVTETYGHCYIFFPKGNYKYFWNNDIDDLYSRLADDTSWYYDFSVGSIGYKDYFNEELKYIVNGYQDSHIEDVDKQEMVFICDEYYLINMKYFNDIRKYIIERRKKRA